MMPSVTISGEKPTAAAFEALHHQAHERCYIANSVTTDVRVEPVLE
jgi:organic hydroperoxide reductase OsmC/OhrA